MLVKAALETEALGRSSTQLETVLASPTPVPAHRDQPLVGKKELSLQPWEGRVLTGVSQHNSIDIHGHFASPPLAVQ